MQSMKGGDQRTGACPKRRMPKRAPSQCLVDYSNLLPHSFPFFILSSHITWTVLPQASCSYPTAIKLPHIIRTLCFIVSTSELSFRSINQSHPSPPSNLPLISALELENPSIEIHTSLYHLNMVTKMTAPFYTASSPARSATFFRRPR